MKIQIQLMGAQIEFGAFHSSVQFVDEKVVAMGRCFGCSGWKSTQMGNKITTRDSQNPYLHARPFFQLILFVVSLIDSHFEMCCSVTSSLSSHEDCSL